MNEIINLLKNQKTTRKNQFSNRKIKQEDLEVIPHEWAQGRLEQITVPQCDSCFAPQLITVLLIISRG